MTAVTAPLHPLLHPSSRPHPFLQTLLSTSLPLSITCCPSQPARGRRSVLGRNPVRPFKHLYKTVFLGGGINTKKSFRKRIRRSRKRILLKFNAFIPKSRKQDVTLQTLKFDWQVTFGHRREKRRKEAEGDLSSKHVTRRTHGGVQEDKRGCSCSSLP